jgi:DNA-binding transcriptional regulator YhcF (GntR family)
VRKYQYVQESLEREIASGHYPVGDKLPSVRKLAVNFNVNALTVQRAIRELKDQRLVEPRHGAGTYVIANAPSEKRAAIQKSGKEIIVFHTSTWNEIIAHRNDDSIILKMAAETAASYSWDLSIEAFPKGVDQLKFISDTLAARDPAGVILLSLGNMNTTREGLNICKRLDIPVVSMAGNCRSEQIGISSVSVNSLEAGVLSADYLLENGVEEATAIYFSQFRWGGQFMLVQGAAARFAEAGMPSGNFQVFSDMRDCMQLSGYRAAKTILKNRPSCKGFVIAHELLAQGSIEYLLEAGKKIGEDFFVSGGPLKVFYDESDYLGQAYDPRAFWFSYPWAKCGMEAVKRLASIRSGDDSPQRVRVDPIIVSTKEIERRELNAKNI